MTLTNETTADIEAELAVRKLADTQLARDTTRDEVQAIIDADTKLTSAGIKAQTDKNDEAWVRLSFPADAAGAPAFWGCIAGLIVEAGGKAVETGIVRTAKGRALAHLTTVSALLPNVEE